MITNKNISELEPKIISETILINELPKKENNQTIDCNANTTPIKLAPKRPHIELEENKNIQNNSPKKKICLDVKKKEYKKFPYGNYNRYYGYRNSKNFQDVRLEIFQDYSNLFKNKDLLDIGCNEGLLTLAVAKMFKLKSLTGVDIDTHLIGKARKNFRSQKETLEEDTFPESVLFKSVINFSFNLFLYKQIFFYFYFQADYILSNETLLSIEEPKFDVILCLSVTKWVHLNNGDIGIKLLFKRIFKQLRPGGCLILETQNFKSYSKRKKLTPQITENYKKIIFKPNQFKEYLLGDEIGFKEFFMMGTPNHLQQGFKRPIEVFVKGI